jgi:hypothetical protein
MMQKLLLPLFIFALVGCQEFNSNTNDDKISNCNGIDSAIAQGQRLQAACVVIDTNCISCHTGYHNKWAGFTTDQQYIDNFDVIPGDAVNSLLISRLKNAGSDMPKDNPQISESEYNVLLDWVSGI